MSATAVGAPSAHVCGRRPEDRSGELRVDLRGLDYFERRRCVFEALRALGPQETLRLTSGQADDVSLLRFEAEARLPRRYRWSLPSGRTGADETLVRLP